MELSPPDWTTLANLTLQAGLPPEQIELLRRRIENAPARRGSPFTLLAGNPNSGIELLLSRWISPEVAGQLEIDRPLVIGPEEQNVRPKFGVWAGAKYAEIVPGHLIALRTARTPPKDTLMQLASLSFIDQLVLVTRLAQPLTQTERNLAAALNSVAATVRVLIIGVPGEEPTERDLAEVAAYAINYMHQAGFSDGRCLGAGVWFTKDGGQGNTISNLGNFLRIDQAKVTFGRDEMFRDALASLFVEIENKSGDTPLSPFIAISSDDRERLVHEFSTYLAALGRKAERDAEGRSVNTDTIREYCLDAFRGWAAYIGVEGHWMKYVETLRPGAHTALLEEAKSALRHIDYEPTPISLASTAQPAPPEKSETPLSYKFFPKALPLLKWVFVPAEGVNAVVQRAVVEAKRAGVALGCGLAGYWIVSSLINTKVGVAGLPMFIISLINTAGFLIAAVLGYGIGCRIFRTSKISIESQTASAATPQPTRPALRNWGQVESRLTAWFAAFLSTSSRSSQDECRALAQRLGISKR